MGISSNNKSQLPKEILIKEKLVKNTLTTRALKFKLKSVVSAIQMRLIEWSKALFIKQLDLFNCALHKYRLF